MITAHKFLLPSLEFLFFGNIIVSKGDKLEIQVCLSGKGWRINYLAKT